MSKYTRLFVRTLQLCDRLLFIAETWFFFSSSDENQASLKGEPAGKEVAKGESPEAAESREVHQLKDLSLSTKDSADEEGTALTEHLWSITQMCPVAI